MRGPTGLSGACYTGIAICGSWNGAAHAATYAYSIVARSCSANARPVVSSWSAGRGDQHSAGRGRRVHGAS
eukprot:6122599-Pyramimonas_sp.AAC.1